MPESIRATEEQLLDFCASNPHWSLQENKLHRQFVFNDFVMAFGFMSQIALIAERCNHHPEWSNLYQKVTVNLTTHEMGSISDKDFILAKEMDRIAAKIL